MNLQQAIRIIVAVLFFTLVILGAGATFLPASLRLPFIISGVLGLSVTLLSGALAALVGQIVLVLIFVGLLPPPWNALGYLVAILVTHFKGPHVDSSTWTRQHRSGDSSDPVERMLERHREERYLKEGEEKAWRIREDMIRADQDRWRAQQDDEREQRRQREVDRKRQEDRRW